VTPENDIIPEGLPDHLPQGEKLVWQGRPDWWQLAVHAFHVRKVVVYFAVIIAGDVALNAGRGTSVSAILSTASVLAGLAVAACGILMLLAYVSARSTHYTLTNKRALMKVGIALPAIINIPYRQVDAVSFAITHADRGNIVFRTSGETRLAYLLLWPHARPWHLSKPQPAFRDIPNVEAVASRLAAVIGGQMPEAAAVHAGLPGQMVPAE
jgi:hypothetical protein